ncbi:MAG: hypothetical protein WCY51_02890 [Sulfurimonas sp.]|uniref:hypothetical protein n=1 Tax=Sulfurimonas sp. TaxID=2022749 RepID=UPI0025D9E067|nr:hypothetical protein [Sulfurimonas sp.]MCK9454520.1 hypothetical protein [Sulfurimonas sp.]
MKNLELFRKLFNPLPGNHYLQVSTEIDEVTMLFSQMMQSVEGKLNLALYNEETLKQKIELLSTNIQQIKDLKHPFRATPRDHDIVLFKDIFHIHESKDMLLKLAYHTLANAANIIIMEKKGVMDVEAVKEMLQEYEFRAPNEIEIVDGYDLVMAKKMHMWGNGL